MSSRSSFIEIDEPLASGVYAGFKPIDLIKKGNLTAIEYFLDLRGTDPKVPRSKHTRMSASLHHVLDSFLRKNERYHATYKTRFTKAEYSLWLAEMKAEKLRKQEQKAAAERAQQERIQKHKAEEAAKLIRQAEQEAEAERRAEIERLQKIAATKERELRYKDTWAAW